MVEFMKEAFKTSRQRNKSLRECPSYKICSQYVKKEIKDGKICCVGWCHRRIQFKEGLSGKPGLPRCHMRRRGGYARQRCSRLEGQVEAF